MAGIHFVTGTLGVGKGLYAARQIQKYVERGCKIACNYDFDTSITNPLKPVPVHRVPDHVEAYHLQELGSGFNQNKAPGLIVLDECATWLNSRNWSKGGRLELIDWFLHARKHGWDVIFLIQSLDAIDKQIKDSLCEFHVKLSRTDRKNIPVISDIFEIIHILRGRKGQPFSLFPHFCQSSTYVKLTKEKVDSDIYKPDRYFGSYDTNYVFNSGTEILNGRSVDMRASYSCLPSTYFKQKLSLSHDSDDSSTKTKKPILKPALTFLSLIVVSFYSLAYVFSDDKTIETTTSFPSNDNPSSSKSTRFPDIRITGSILEISPNHKKFEYFFEDKKGVFRPYRHGYTVTSINDCHAIITKQSHSHNVYCYFQS